MLAIPYYAERRSTTQYDRDLVTFVDIMLAKNNIVEYEGDVIMFVFNKRIIINNKYYVDHY